MADKIYGQARRGFRTNKLTEKAKRKIKSRMTGGDSTGTLFPNV